MNRNVEENENSFSNEHLQVSVVACLSIGDVKDWLDLLQNETL
jgi:hypothetical protein